MFVVTANFIYTTHQVHFSNWRKMCFWEFNIYHGAISFESFLFTETWLPHGTTTPQVMGIFNSKNCTSLRGSCPTWSLVGLLVNLQSSPSDLSELVKKLGHMLKLKAWIYSGHCVVKDDSDRSNPSFTHWRVLFYLPMEKSGLKVNHHICFALKS